MMSVAPANCEPTHVVGSPLASSPAHVVGGTTRAQQGD